jgi:hypothetical protein
VAGGESARVRHDTWLVCFVNGINSGCFFAMQCGWNGSGGSKPQTLPREDRIRVRQNDDSRTPAVLLTVAPAGFNPAIALIQLIQALQ